MARRSRFGFSIDNSAVDLMLRSRTGPVMSDLQKRGRRAGALARQKAPGSMKSMIKVTTQRGVVEISCSHEATIFVTQGTKPHKIRPKSRSPKARLRFTKNGKVIFAREVNHPGFKGDNFLWKAVIEAGR